MRLLLLVAVLGGVAKGGKLYIKGDGVELLDKPKTGKKLMALPAGTEVTWMGPNDADKSWHAVEYKGKKGFVHMTALTPNKAQPEPTEMSSANAFSTGGPGFSENALRVAQEGMARDAPVYSAWASDPAYVALRQLTDGTTAQRAKATAKGKK